MLAMEASQGDRVAGTKSRGSETSGGEELDRGEMPIDGETGTGGPDERKLITRARGASPVCGDVWTSFDSMRSSLLSRSCKPARMADISSRTGAPFEEFCTLMFGSRSLAGRPETGSAGAETVPLLSLTRRATRSAMSRA